MATETQTTIQREAPEIEAYKIGLMEQAKGLTGRPPIGGLPDIRSAGMTPAQLQALQLQQGGVGSYQPYINAAQASYAAGLGTLGSTQPNALGMIASSVPMAAQGADQAGQSIGYGQQGANLSQAGADLTRSGLGYGQQGVGLSQTGADLTRSGIGYGQAGADLTRSGIGYGQAGADLTRSGLGFGQQGVGIAQLGAQQYDPTSVSAYMNPYQSAISDEINRAYDIQQNQAAAQAVGAGAFGGSRGEIAAREVDRNRVSALAKAQADNYLQAQQAAMGAFEGQQGRQQNVGQLQQNLAQMAAQAGSQQQQAGKQFADIGQFALQAGDARQKAAQIAQQAGSAYGGMGLSQAESLARLGRSQADLGAMQQGLQQQDISGLASLGEQQRNIRQQELEARRQTDMQNIYEPYQRLGFYSDILRGAPSTQSTLTVANTPNPSLLNQVVGGATAGLGIYGAANRGGLI